MQRNIVINSAILFVIASIVEMTLHEFGHFFASILVHAQQVSIHHNYTSNADEGLSLSSTLLIKGSGPAVSLLIGILFHAVCAQQGKRNSLFLFNLYMSAFGYIGFFGYLMIAPVSTAGDTGYICNALGFPLWLTIAVAIMAGIILYLVMNRLTKYFVELGSQEIIENPESRKVFIRSLILIPLMLGIGIVTLLNLPVPIWISLMAPVLSPLTFLWSYGNAINKRYSLEKVNREFGRLDRLQPILFFFLALTIAGNRLLVAGIYAN